MNMQDMVQMNRAEVEATLLETKMDIMMASEPAGMAASHGDEVSYFFFKFSESDIQGWRLTGGTELSRRIFLAGVRDELMFKFPSAFTKIPPIGTN